MNSDFQQQLIADLIVESYEGLDRFDRELLALEAGKATSDTLNNIFRIIHTIKGTSGCLALNHIERVAHAGENLLELVRSAKITVNPEIISTLLKLSDSLRAMLRSLETAGNEGSEDHIPLLQKLEQLSRKKTGDTNISFGFFDQGSTRPPFAAAKPVTTPPIPATPAPSAHAPASPAIPAHAHQPAPVSVPAPAPAPVPTAATPVAHVPPAATAPAHPEDAPAAKAADPAKGSVADSAIRVDVSQLDRLMNLVGELVLARNQIAQNTATSHDANLITAAQRLNIITTELQEGVMKTRMQPIENIWARFPRIVRDVSHELGKKVRLEMEGKETELDRTIIEAIKDPLTHLIRNAIDHGIETPEKRQASNKSEEGLLALRAFHEGGQVNIEIADDGAGINVAAVKKKALEKGLLTPEQAARLSTREALSLIFLPGLSTAAKVTNLSGRGVGMDVVKTNIEKIGGSVDIQSEELLGTTIKIKIPLTLAIIPALVITSAGERFAIPQVSLVELVRLEGDAARKGIEYVLEAPIYRLRGKLLPLVYLNQLLKLPNSAAASDVANIVVLKAGEHQFGLVVDQVNDTQEIVVKPLGKHLKRIEVFAGATIMGDGRVALILDVFGLAQHAHVVSQTQEGHTREKEIANASSDYHARQTLLVFTLGAGSRLAMPLSSVGRLEKFPRHVIERSGPNEVVQYRGQILPLLRLVDALGGDQQLNNQAELPVVVYSAGDRRIGLVVGRIEDIVEDTLALESQHRRTGILGSAIIQGKVTEMVDVPALVARVAS